MRFTMALQNGHEERKLLDYEEKVEELVTSNGSSNGSEQNQEPMDDTDRVMVHTPYHGHYSLPTAGFRDMLLKPEILSGIFGAGFEQPSQVQAECIPKAMSGVDILCQAKSGMGKTVLFVISTLEMIDPQNHTQPTVLVLAPTRELAYQIGAQYRRFGRHLGGIRIGLFCDGTPLLADIQNLRAGPVHIVLGTPGRLTALVRERVLNLSHIKHFIVDECDKVLRQLDMQSDVHEIFLATPFEKQVMMFSATFPTAVLQDCRTYLSKEAFESQIKNPAPILSEDAQKQESMEDGFFYSEGSEKVIICIGGEDQHIVFRSVERLCPSDLGWGNLMSLPIGVCNAGLVARSEFIYLCGGQLPDGSASGDTFRFDTFNNKWEAKKRMNSPRFALGIAAFGEYIYAIGGCDGRSVLNTVERYCIPSDNWEFVADLPVPLSGCSVVDLEGSLYVFGGVSDRGFSDEVLRYAHQSGSWSSAKSVHVSRTGAVACVGPDNFIYIAGGISNEKVVLNRLDAYNPIANEWIPKSSMAVGRYLPGIAFDSEGFFVFGGQQLLDSPVDTVEAYNFAKDEWVLLETVLPCARSGLSCVSVPINKSFTHPSFQMDPVRGRIVFNRTAQD
ncbi:uncharacterized protein LOC129601808 [Paramacrobiotus metropolitanus]|uniref:uncharacterized protein LOC129601808 n=1 Tax=Paramacrobiotus metropolitanus TaxID=2943436 RepID=UPI002445BB73|nr:uncharacterized protein LOC129601808 [Paramacrobiotus metropolitanus]XP_055356682.1 uncharacterized protein LOC129601808 [Paramacrobiotus metropolitanus]XP_055356683.1 uncharacterized protein LOC129601808 [Paramacrobiotus metropolitanus]XP_055356684.1 uncharacterized protein LOC129601808 [Paramacrobiotus metropolitanus]